MLVTIITSHPGLVAYEVLSSVFASKMPEKQLVTHYSFTNKKFIYSSSLRLLLPRIYNLQETVFSPHRCFIQISPKLIMLFPSLNWFL